MEPTRRFVDADNSCLYSSIGYQLNHKDFNEMTKYEYRQLLANHLEKMELDSVMLGMSKEEYINNVLDVTSWGGGTDIRFFCDMFQMQISVINIQTNSISTFGEDKPYPQRIYLIYNGIHYDPLVMAMTHDNKDDKTIFASDDDETAIAFQNYAKTFRDKGEFVDLSKMNTLECDSCKQKFTTQDDAQSHALNYNHWNFSAI